METERKEGQGTVDCSEEQQINEKKDVDGQAELSESDPGADTEQKLLFQRLLRDSYAMENIRRFQDQLRTGKVGHVKRAPVWQNSPWNFLLCKVNRQTWKGFEDTPGVQIFKKDPLKAMERQEQQQSLNCNGETQTPDYGFTTTGKLDRSKKLLVIFNPRAGVQSSDKKQRILDILHANKVDHEFYETKMANDTFNVTNNINLDNYSGIAVVGGDGTVHEAFNGLLMRDDGKRVPIGVLPNGSGDDFVGNLGVNSGDLEQSMKFLIKGQTMKIDAVKVLLDYETEEQLREAAARDPTINILDHLRYSVTNSSLCLSANCARNAIWMKPAIGKHAYTIQTIIELIRRRREVYDVEVDRESLIKNHGDEHEISSDKLKEGEQQALNDANDREEPMVMIKKDFDTQVCLVYNGKFGGGRITLSPMSMINDGYFEMIFVNERFSASSAMQLFHYCKLGGKHVFLDNVRCFRIKKLKLTNKRVVEGAGLLGDAQYVPQDVNIDGEDLIFKRSITYQIMPQVAEVIVDFEHFVKKFCLKSVNE